LIVVPDSTSMMVQWSCFALFSIFVHCYSVASFAPRWWGRSGGFTLLRKKNTLPPPCEAAAPWIELQIFRNACCCLSLSSNKDDTEICKQQKKKIAEDFVQSIMAEYEEIPGSNGMHVLRNVTELEDGRLSDIVIRNITEPFWQACIDMVDESNERKRLRVCAVGTPGIGKTTSIPILIRMLLKEGHTVVYLVRTTEEKTEWYYEFTSNKENNTCTANVYPESAELWYTYDVLFDSSTYYVVDCGKILNDSNPASDFVPKVILVASPDERHWGESEFVKERDGDKGFFKYIPLWSYNELLCARLVLGQKLAHELTENDIKERYHQFGGVPQIIYAEDSGYNEALAIQQKALNRLTAEQALKIARKEMDAVEDERGQGVLLPKKALIGYQIAESDDGSFDDKEVVVISAFVADVIDTKYIK
jgi:hypothetical protein